MFFCTVLLSWLVGLSSSSSSSSSYIGTSVLLKEAASEKGAVCLDGSAARYYFAEAESEESKSKYLMFVQGGAWCNGIYEKYSKGADTCIHRLSTDLGTTSKDNETMDFNGYAMLGNNETISPLMYDWNKIFVRYCDGGSFSGDMNDAVIYEIPNSDKYGSMYFRGKRILDAVFDDLLENKNLSNVTDFVFSGGSAGGLAVWLHSNRIYKKYFQGKNMKFVAMPDVGFFLDYNGYNETYYTNFSNSMKWVYYAMNISSSIYATDCFNYYKNTSQDWKCIFAQNICKEMTMDTFVLNSQYDSYQSDNILGTSTNSIAIENEYGQNFTRLLIENFLKYNGDKNIYNAKYGAYIDSCYHHDADEPIWWYGLNINNMTQAQAFSQFYNNADNNFDTRWFWYQNVSYPCTKCCPT